MRSKRVLIEEDIQLILKNLINRMRFIYSNSDLTKYVFTCMCCRRAFDRKKGLIYNKKQYLFDKGEKKMHYELDIITHLRSMRQTRLLAQGILD